MNTYNTALLILIFIPYEFTVIHVIQTLCCSPKIVAIIAIKNDLVENYDKEDKHLFYIFLIFHYLFLNIHPSFCCISFFVLESLHFCWQWIPCFIWKETSFCSPLKSNFAEYVYVILHIFSVSNFKDFSQDFCACLVFDERFTVFLIHAPLQFCLFHLHSFHFIFLSLFLVFYSLIIYLGVFVCAHVCVCF